MPAPAIRAPRFQIVSQGQVLGGALSFTVASNSYLQADSFTAQFSLNADPAHGLAWWSSQTPPQLLDIQASTDGGQSWRSLILGQVDHITPALERGCVEVDGRDFVTATLIDTVSNDSYLNQTAARICQAIAGKHGFTADVTEVPGLVGQFDGVDHTVLAPSVWTRSSSQWNVLAALAGNTGFDVWATGTTLHFQPPATTPSVTVLWDEATRTGNVEALTLTRAVYLDDIAVLVRSWNRAQAQAIKAQAGSGSDVRVFNRPGLTLQAAQAKADQIYADLTAHRFTVAFTLPGDLTTSARDVISLQGVPSFDRLFRVDKVRRAMSFQEGFTMHVSGKVIPAS